MRSVSSFNDVSTQDRIRLVKAGAQAGSFNPGAGTVTFEANLGMNLVMVDARERFLARLAGVEEQAVHNKAVLAKVIEKIK